MTEIWQIIGTLGAGFIIIPLIICMLGCGSSGVRGGSAAARYQSSRGNVESGSIFSCIQSFVAKGVFFTMLIIGISFLIGGSTVEFWDQIQQLIDFIRAKIAERNLQ